MHGSVEERGARVALRYALYQTPGIAAVTALLAVLAWEDVVTTRTALLVGSLWVVLEGVLYPLTRDAYRSAPVGARMVGRRGVARRRLDPGGWVFVDGTLWRARAGGADPPIEAGEEVEVVAVDGHRLTVAAVPRQAS